MLSTFRLYYTELVSALINAGENEKALIALDKVTGMIPDSLYPTAPMGSCLPCLLPLGRDRKAESLISTIQDRVSATSIGSRDSLPSIEQHHGRCDL